MRYLCFGVGAIGAYIGGYLLQDGNEVVFFDRQKVGQEFAQKGLRIVKENGQVITLKPKIEVTLEKVFSQNNFDAGILAIKSFDTVGWIEKILPHLEQLPPVLCLQNGVENEDLIRRSLGDELVIPGSVTSAIGKRELTSIIVERQRGVGISSTHPLSEALIQNFNSAGLNTKPYLNWRSMKWSKLVTNLLANASSAILDLPPYAILSSKVGYHLEMEQIREAILVMGKLNISAVNLPGTPVKALTFSASTLPEWIGRPLLAAAGGKGRGNKMPSFHIDLHSGKKQLETDYLNGAVVRIGQEIGIPTPINAFLNTTINGMAEGSIPMTKFAGNITALWDAAAQFRLKTKA